MRTLSKGSKMKSLKMGNSSKNKTGGFETSTKNSPVKKEKPPARLKFKSKDGSDHSGQTTPRTHNATPSKHNVHIHEHTPVTPSRMGIVTFPKLDPV